jgi:hypothetical protein
VITGDFSAAVDATGLGAAVGAAGLAADGDLDSTLEVGTFDCFWRAVTEILPSVVSLATSSA